MNCCSSRAPSSLRMRRWFGYYANMVLRTLFHLHQIIDAREARNPLRCVLARGWIYVCVNEIYVVPRFFQFFPCRQHLTVGVRGMDGNLMLRQDMVVEDIPRPQSSSADATSRKTASLFTAAAVVSPTLHCTAHCCVAITFFTFLSKFFILIAEKMFAICWVYCCLRFRVVGTRGEKGWMAVTMYATDQSSMIVDLNLVVSINCRFKLKRVIKASTCQPS